MQVSKLLARLFVVAFLAVQIFRPVGVKAQASPTGVDTEYCTDNPDDASCNRTVGGQNVTPKDIAAAINSPTPNLANTTAYVFYTITVLLTGTFNPEIANAGATTTSNPTTVNMALQQGGLVGGIGYLMGAMIKNPPASAEVYIVDMVQNSRFAPQSAYAQAPGLGFGALDPILGTWKAFRNVSYYLLVLIGFVVGFLVLIRHKVSGNVAVTVQNALPRIVITVILITFSYAIAGLMVDLLFLSIYFIINIFSNGIFVENARFLNNSVAGITNSEGQSLSDLAFNTHIFEFTINYIFSGAAWNAANSIGDIITQALGNASTITNAFLGIDDFIGGPIQWIIDQLFALVFAIAIFIAMFRTFFALIMSYAGFVINVVMAPFILLPGAMPGKNPFSNWIKNLVAGLAPFAVAIFMIFMSLALTGEETECGIGYNVGENPNCPAGSGSEELTGLRLPLIMSGADTDAFVGILAMGFILLLPEAVNMTKKAVGASGGMFDEFKDKAVANLQKGWSGNQYVPGAKKVAPALAAGALIGGGGAIVGGGLKGISKATEMADKNGVTGIPRRFMQATGAVGGTAAGALLSPYTATIGGAAATGVALGSPLVKKGVELGKVGYKKLDSASAVGGQIRDALRERTEQNVEAKTTQPNANPQERSTATSPLPQQNRTTATQKGNSD